MLLFSLKNQTKPIKSLFPKKPLSQSTSSKTHYDFQKSQPKARKPLSKGYIPFKEVKYIPIPAVLIKYAVPAVKSLLVLLYNVKLKKKKKSCTGLYRLYFRCFVQYQCFNWYNKKMLKFLIFYIKKMLFKLIYWLMYLG